LRASESRTLAASIINSRTLSSLQNPVYRLYFFGMLGQFASMNMQMVTGSLLIFRLTESPALLGTMSLAYAVPMILISIFGGAIADRVQKKRVVVLSLVASAAISLFIGLSLATGNLSKEHLGSWWILVLTSFLQGSVMGIMLPARQAIIPEIVSRDQAMNAVALNMLGMNVLSLGAPGIAGFLIDAFDFKAVYFTMTALNLYAAVTVAFIHHTSRVSQQQSNIIEDIKKGFRYIGQDRTILLVLLFTLMVVVLSMPYQQLLPIYVDTILKVGAKGMGALMTVSGVGALVGSLFIANLANKKRGLLLLGSGLLSGAALIFFAFSHIWGLSLGLMVFLGLGQSLRGTVGSALLQSYTEPEFMGRVMSILMMQWGVMSLCTFGAGLLAEIVPVQWVLGGLSVALLILTALSIIFSARLRKLD
jgi:MFS transporter, DHA1 family, staphyloferrin A biosynthesis exporter